MSFPGRAKARRHKAKLLSCISCRQIILLIFRVDLPTSDTLIKKKKKKQSTDMNSSLPYFSFQIQFNCGQRLTFTDASWGMPWLGHSLSVYVFGGVSWQDFRKWLDPGSSELINELTPWWMALLLSPKTLKMEARWRKWALEHILGLCLPRCLPTVFSLISSCPDGTCYDVPYFPM